MSSRTGITRAVGYHMQRTFSPSMEATCKSQGVTWVLVVEGALRLASDMKLNTSGGRQTKAGKLLRDRRSKRGRRKIKIVGGGGRRSVEHVETHEQHHSSLKPTQVLKDRRGTHTGSYSQVQWWLGTTIPVIWLGNMESNQMDTRDRVTA